MSIWMLACPLMMMGLPGALWVWSRISRSRENTAFRPMCLPSMPARRVDGVDAAEGTEATRDDVPARVA
jgi:hypothetical protein